MERFVKRDIVVLNFSFTDLSSFRRRPSLVVADLQGNDIILCQITREKREDIYSIILKNNDFEKGGLKKESRIRPNKLFTGQKSKILYKIGNLKQFKIREVENKIIDIFLNIKNIKIFLA